MTCEIGVIGLGVMGRNLLLNMAEHGFSVAGYDIDPSKVAALKSEVKNGAIFCANSDRELVAQLRLPRAVMLLIPAGKAVDAAISQLAPLLQKGDIIIDAGNSYFKDTTIRAKQLSVKCIQLVGVGISGGEEGARRGPSIMPGGSIDSYARLRPLFEAIAAKVNGEPCVAYLGSGSAGHFVKMVHNGIEYGLMQLISETYDLMKRGLGINDDELHDIYAAWNQTELASFLLEITADIFSKVDEKSGKRLIDEILDVARQKGTGMWTSQVAMELQVPIPTIDLAVAQRNLSMDEKMRQRAAMLLKRPIEPFQGDRKTFLTHLQAALYVGQICTYAQGMAVLGVASEKFHTLFSGEDVARIWRGGCIIRSALLEDIRKAYQAESALPNLLLNPGIANKIFKRDEALRYIVCQAAKMAVPAPGFMSVLSYLDSYRSSWLPANLIQAQRDYFGAHSYERVDGKGTFHTEWEKI